MKLIKAYVRDSVINKVVNALRDLKATPMTVMNAKALGDEIGHSELEILAKVGMPHTKMVKIEVVCSDESAERIKDTIIAAARNGHKGEGLIAFFQLRELKA